MDQALQAGISARPAAIFPAGDGGIAEAAGRQLSAVEVGEVDAVGVVGGAPVEVDVSEGEDERGGEAGDGEGRRGAGQQAGVGEEEARAQEAEVISIFYVAASS